MFEFLICWMHDSLIFSFVQDSRNNVVPMDSNKKGVYCDIMLIILVHANYTPTVTFKAL